MLPAYLSPFIYISSLALCRISCSYSIEFKSIRTHCMRTNVTLAHTPHPQSHLDGACRAALVSMIFLVCWWICKMSLIFLAPCPILLFSTLAGLLYGFSWCAVRERGQPHPSAEWHSMRRRKELEKSCLVLFLMSKSMHLSFKRCKREKKTEKLLGLQGPGQNTHTEAVTSCYE